jgi:hypothetical protein
MKKPSVHLDKLSHVRISRTRRLGSALASSTLAPVTLRPCLSTRCASDDPPGSPLRFLSCLLSIPFSPFLLSPHRPTFLVHNPSESSRLSSASQSLAFSSFPLWSHHATPRCFILSSPYPLPCSHPSSINRSARRSILICTLTIIWIRQTCSIPEASACHLHHFSSTPPPMLLLTHPPQLMTLEPNLASKMEKE